MTGSSTEISRLLSEARRGQRETIAALLEAYRNYLSLLAQVQISKQFRGRVSPPDVVQETFIQASHVKRNPQRSSAFLTQGDRNAPLHFVRYCRLLYSVELVAWPAYGRR